MTALEAGGLVLIVLNGLLLFPYVRRDWQTRRLRRGLKAWMEEERERGAELRYRNGLRAVDGNPMRFYWRGIRIPRRVFEGSRTHRNALGLRTGVRGQRQ